MDDGLITDQHARELYEAAYANHIGYTPTPWSNLHPASRYTWREWLTRQEYERHGDDSWIERAAHLIYDDHVHGLGVAALFQPPWSSLTDKSRWLALARRVGNIEGNHS